MIKRTPQEIADFFGGYVARDKDGEGYFLFDGKPEIDEDEEQWFLPLKCSVGVLDKECINKQPDHDWTHLYEPQKKDPIEVFKDIQSRRESAQHQSEVHVEKEYMIVTAHKEIDADTFAEGVMIWIRAGWKPCGGISFDKKGCPYQAMVRGV